MNAPAGLKRSPNKSSRRRRNLKVTKGRRRRSAPSVPAITTRPYLSRTSKVGGGVQFNVEPVSDDESDGDDYREHTQDVDDEAMRHWIFVAQQPSMMFNIPALTG